MSSEPEFTQNSRSKLWLMAGGVAAVFVIGVGGIWFYGVTALNSELESLRASGLPVTAREVNTFYAVPVGVPDTTEVWVRAIMAVQAANLSSRGKTLPLIGSGTSPIPVPGQAWAELDETRTLLGECGPELKAIRAAVAAGGQVRFPIDLSAGINTLLPHTQESRQVARVLALDAWVSAHDGKADQVLSDVRGIFAVSDALRGEPLLISQLVRIAIHAVGCDVVARLMPHCAWSDAELKLLQSAVQSARFKDEMARAYVGERAICLASLDDMPLGPLRQTNAREILRLFNGSISSFSGSWPQVVARQSEVGSELNAVATSGIFERTRLSGVLRVLPAIQQAAIAGSRAEARQKCLSAAIAVERFRLQQNRDPESLAEIEGLLAPGPAAEPMKLIDPFDDQPLRYKVDDKRILIYSVGDNKTDDGGDVGRDEQPPGQPVQQPRDIGFSVQRR